MHFMDRQRISQCKWPGKWTLLFSIFWVILRYAGGSESRHSHDHDHEEERQCPYALGMENRDIINKQITASSFYTGQGGLNPWKGRLNNDAYWATAGPDCAPTDAWIRVDLLTTFTIKGIVTQGSGDPYEEWVDEVQIQYGDSTSSLQYVMEDGRPKFFAANEDADNNFKIRFPDQVSARFLVIRPTHCIGWCSMRFEVKGCIEDNHACTTESCLNGGTCITQDISGDEAVTYCQCASGYHGINCEFEMDEETCTEPLGMENEEIFDEQITSSSHNGDHEPWLARLDWEDYWIPGRNSGEEWIQVEGYEPTIASGIITQGAGRVDKWVEDLWIQFGRTEDSLVYIIDPYERAPMTFTANSDSNTHAIISFPNEIRGLFLRIIPKSCHNYCALRFEILGCEADPCESSPCSHNGYCEIDGAGYTYCECPREWVGETCEIVNPCYPNPCYNGGECEMDIYDTVATQYCSCRQGYTGTYCEIDISVNEACSQDPCLNGGTCVTESYSLDYYCECLDDFEGTHCEIPLSHPCDEEPCHYGFCIPEPGSADYYCECEYGYNGDLCDNDFLAPEIYCEAGLSYQIESGNTDIVNWDLPYVWDNSEEYDETDGDAVTVRCDPPSGTVFSVGQRTVWCYANDASFNFANCSFDVQISTLEVPEIYCIGDLRIPAEEGSGYAVVTYPDPSAPNANSYSCWPESGSNFKIGDTTVTCQAWLNGISAKCIFNVFVKDLQKPTITCPDNKEATTAFQASYNQVWFQLPEASDNSGRVHTWCDPPSGTIFYLGVDVVICYAVDDHDNEETCSFTVDVLDNEPPRVSCPGRKIVPTDYDKSTGEVWFSGEIQTWDNSDEFVDVVCDPREGFFGLGNSDVTCVATDQSGNSNDCSFQVTVYDDQAPNILCPTDMYVKRDPNEPGVRIDWEVETWDNADASPSWGCGPDMDHIFQYGTTTVTCVAQDTSDNRAHCQFNVEVTDYNVPEIYCPEDIELETLPGENFNEAKWAIPTYTTGDSDEGTVECDHQPGEFEIGTHTVECKVTNSFGTSSACVFFIHVEDTEAPTIQCPANRILVSESGEPITPVYNDGPSYTDNSGIANMYCDPHLKTSFDIGSHTITCTAMDRSGNIDSCSFGIRIIEVVILDPCDFGSNQCNGNGRCITTSLATKEYTCVCDDGWKGQFCGEMVEDYCSNSPCNTEGTSICVNLADGSGYECMCRSQWTGTNCEVFVGSSEDSTTESTVSTDAGGKVDGSGGVNSAQTNLNTGAIVGSAAGGLVLIILVLIIAIVIVGYRNRTKTRRESTMPLADRRTSEAKHQEKVKGLENPSFSTKSDNRYAFPPPPPNVQPPRLLVAPPVAPPPNMPPPAYAEYDNRFGANQAAAAVSSTGGAVYDNKIGASQKVPPSGGVSVIYDNGAGSAATYGAYENPDGMDTNNYEEIGDRDYATIGRNYEGFINAHKN